MRCNMHLVRTKKRIQGARVRMQAKKVQLAKIQLQKESTNEKVKDILSDSQGKLVEIFQDSVARNRHLFSSSWHKYGDTCSKTFFDFHRIGKKKALLRELETEFGTISGQSNLSQYIIDFYTHLYSLDTHAFGTVEAQEQCWVNVPVRVTIKTNAFLTRNFTLKEIHDAISALPKGKALRHDGVLMEFFQKCADEVAPMLLKAFTAMLNSG
ncbi:unnamed protein product [Sphagnum troendelagicum]|uniref:Uncharacterized protein n=1 Tax=Sphagnum troendelagicum TaxID=128251 RepID=A0ABP0UNM5_9BRYO